MDENNNAVASLVLGILSIVIPILGLIIGIFGIIYANKCITGSNISDENRKYAVAGRICSIVGICVQSVTIVLVVLGFIVFMFLVQLF